MKLKMILLIFALINNFNAYVFAAQNNNGKLDLDEIFQRLDGLEQRSFAQIDQGFVVDPQVLQGCGQSSSAMTIPCDQAASSVNPMAATPQVGNINGTGTASNQRPLTASEYQDWEKFINGINPFLSDRNQLNTKETNELQMQADGHLSAALANSDARDDVTATRQIALIASLAEEISKQKRKKRKLNIKPSEQNGKGEKSKDEHAGKKLKKDNESNKKEKNQCECGYIASTPSHLIVHKRRHTGEKPFACIVKNCNRSFSTKSSLKRHEKKHTGEKPYVCSFDLCGKSFSDSNDLKSHERIHKGEKSDNSNANSSSLNPGQSNLSKIINGKKYFLCNLCGKRYSRNGDLNNHKNIAHSNKN